MLEQLEARAIVWTVAGVYFAATVVLSVITCSIMRTRSKRTYRVNEPDVGVAPVVASTLDTVPNGSPNRLKSPNKVNRSDSTKPLVHKDRLCSECDSGDSPDGTTANNSGTTSPQDNLTVVMNSSPGSSHKSPHKVNRSESTKPLVKRDALGSENSEGDQAVEGQPTEHHEMVGMNEERGQTLDEVFEEDETVAGDDKTHKTDPSGISEEHIDKKIEKRVEEGKRRRRSNPRKESTKPLTGTSVSESST